MSKGFAPFYEGQEVVAVDALPGSRYKNGQHYIVTACHYSPSSNPIANGRSFWYVGIDDCPPWIRPSIFAPLDEFKPIELSEVIAEEIKLVSAN